MPLRPEGARSRSSGDLRLGGLGCNEPNGHQHLQWRAAGSAPPAAGDRSRTERLRPVSRSAQCRRRGRGSRHPSCAACHGQAMGVAELGRSDRERVVEIHHKPPLHGGNSLNGLGLAVLTQHPLEHLKNVITAPPGFSAESRTATKLLAWGPSVKTSSKRRSRPPPAAHSQPISLPHKGVLPL